MRGTSRPQWQVELGHRIFVLARVRWLELLRGEGIEHSLQVIALREPVCREHADPMR